MADPTEDEKVVMKEQIGELLGTVETGEETPPVEGDVPPIEGETPPIETPPVEGEVPPIVPPVVPPIVPLVPEDDSLTLPETLPTDPAELTALLQKTFERAVKIRDTVNEISKGPSAQVIPEVPPVGAAPPGIPSQPVINTEEAINILKELSNASKEILTKEELDKVVDDPSLINVAIQRSIDKMTAGIIQALPVLTGEIVKQHTALQTVVNDFYKENKDLEPFRDYVMKVSQDIGKRKPNISVGDLLVETRTEVRKNLKLPEPKPAGAAPPVAKPPVTRVSKPAFAKQRQVSSPVIKPASGNSDTKKQIRELM